MCVSLHWLAVFITILSLFSIIRPLASNLPSVQLFVTNFLSSSAIIVTYVLYIHENEGKDKDKDKDETETKAKDETIIEKLDEHEQKYEHEYLMQYYELMQQTKPALVDRQTHRLNDKHLVDLCTVH